MRHRSTSGATTTATSEASILAAILAQKVMGWTVGPNRYLMGNREWKPLWRFRPAENLEHAFELLDSAGPEEYSISGGKHRECRVKVRINGRTGKATAASKPLAIACAVARALGIEATHNEGDSR